MTRVVLHLFFTQGQIVWHRISGCRGMCLGFAVSGEHQTITYKVVWDDRATDWHYAQELTDQYAVDAAEPASDHTNPVSPVNPD